ncbi:MAG: hypothetical protein ACKVXR_10865 [Planctomycetota bacterium]
MKTELLYASLIFVLACGPASNHSESLSGPSSSDDINSLDRTPGDQESPRAPTPPVRPAPESGNPTGPRVNPNAPPTSILSKPYFDEPDLGGTLDVPDGTGNLPVVGELPGMTQFRARYARVRGNPGLIEVTLNNTGSGWVEKFLLYTPVLTISHRAPLLVVFHRFGVSHWDAYYWTDYIEQARQRGWFVVAPLGATHASFGSLESQINIEAALRFTADNFNVDRRRVYGVGFSMGGGDVTSYAARHLDPSGLMFAAIVNHTGGVSLANTWANEWDDNDGDDGIPNPLSHLEVPDLLEYWYGGPPSANYFNYQRSSTIDLDPTTETVGLGTDMSRNLAHIPVRNWMASSDPMVYLRSQTLAFDTHVQLQNPGNQFTTVPATIHKWSTLDFAATCDWLSQFTLQVPMASSTLADQDGKYFHFEVDQDVSGAFTPFSWIIDPITNRIVLYATGNLDRVSIDATAAGLAYSGALKLNVNTADGTGDEIRFVNVPQAPVSVTRDGLPATGTWDPLANTFVVTESTNTTHMWRLNF